MRYQDWDVLLFPEGSKVPIQEFKTQCHVIRDLAESPFLHSSIFTGAAFASDGNPVTQLPVLTCFVPSLFQNAPFRISIHSWEKPKPSGMIESLVSPGDVVLFEARVYIDGVLVADSVFDQRTLWPHILDTSAQLDAAGKGKPLRFPQFHQEILYQSHWEAGELLGRIRVIISEGFSRDIGVPQGNFFDRIQDVVAFSFQHAPLHILEFSSIAWPNAGMWRKAPGQIVNRGHPRGTKNLHPQDLHAHSPRLPTGWSARAMLPPMAPASDPTSAACGLSSGLSTASSLLLTEDPFIDFRRTNAAFRRSKPSTLDDTSMPDYISTSTERSRAYSDMTGLSYERKKDTSTTTLMDNDATLEELVHRLSPEKAREILVQACTPSDDNESGIQVPTNSPSSNVKLPSQPSTTLQKPNSKVLVDDFGRSADYETSNQIMSSSPISPELTDFPLIRTVTINASPAGSARNKNKLAFDNEDLLQSRSTSFEITKSTSNTFKEAVSTAARPIIISSDAKRNRSESNSSKRKRSSPPSPKIGDGGTDPCSPTKASIEA